MGDATIMELVRQGAAQGAEIVEMGRRIGVLEGQVWWAITLLVMTLTTSFASLFFSRKAANGKKATA